MTNPLTTAFIAALNEYSAIYQGEPCNSRQLRTIAEILHRIDRPGRRRRYLATTSTPTIDGYIDFVTDERSTHAVG
jgi:hypothetical protein